MSVYITFKHFWRQNHLGPYFYTIYVNFFFLNLGMHKVPTSSIVVPKILIFSVILMLK